MNEATKNFIRKAMFFGSLIDFLNMEKLEFTAAVSEFAHTEMVHFVNMHLFIDGEACEISIKSKGVQLYVFPFCDHEKALQHILENWNN